MTAYLTKIKIILFLCLFYFQSISSQENYPVLKEIVTDNAALFSETELLQLRQKLTAYESKTTNQIVVLTINDLGINTVENYAYQVFNLNGNKFGQAAVDNGLLILVAKNNRKFRIEVGDGLTPIITDAFASRVNRINITPAFKKGNYFNGIDEATSEIIKLIESPEYRDEFANFIKEEEKTPLWGKILFFVFISAFLGVFIFVGSKMFIKGYKQLINVFRGFITGKISLLVFPLLLVSTLLVLLLSLPFIIMPLFFAFIIFTKTNDEKASIDPFILVENLDYITLNNTILFAVTLFILIPFITAYFTRSINKYTPLKFSLTKSDKSYMSKNFSSAGSSSSSFSSGSSGSSFSGGGGSSSGGGSSGSW